MMAFRLSLLCLASLTFSPALGIDSDSTKVNIEAIPLLTEVEQGKPVQQSVMLRLHSPDIEGANQDQPAQNQDLIVVLDVSGSMRQGAKLEKAKAAIAGIINSLRPSDRLHLITYHSSARVEFRRGAADKKEELLSMVAELTPQSSTNLYAGLQAAEQLLQAERLLQPESGIFSSIKHVFSKAAESESPSVKRIFLFSDGLVNSGITDHRTILAKVEALRQKGITTSAFGIGADYDQKLMSSIAESGHGEFFFIQGQDDMEKVVRVATTGFRNLFATAARLRLTALNEATGLHAYGQSYHQDDGKMSIDINLGDLRGGDARTVLVDVMLPGLHETTAYLAYELEYLTNTASEPVKQSGRTTVRVITDGSRIAETNNAVLLFRKLQRHLVREEEIEQQIESGDIHRAGFLEDELEEDLRDTAVMACAGPETREASYTCSRATSAWDRTRKSQKILKAESFNQQGGMASNFYKFKRQMNMELSESKDEL